MLSSLPDATEITEPSLILSFSFAPAGTCTISPTPIAVPILSGSRWPPDTLKHCPCEAITVPAGAAYVAPSWSRNPPATSSVRKTFLHSIPYFPSYTHRNAGRFITATRNQGSHGEGELR